jgi:hypothetical protein
MDLYEDITVQMAKERIESAVREAELRRAIRLARGHRSTRIRLGNALVRLGQWVLGEPTPAHSGPRTCPE